MPYRNLPHSKWLLPDIVLAWSIEFFRAQWGLQKRKSCSKLYWWEESWVIRCRYCHPPFHCQKWCQKSSNEAFGVPRLAWPGRPNWFRIVNDPHIADPQRNRWDIWRLKDIDSLRARSWQDRHPASHSKFYSCPKATKIEWNKTGWPPTFGLLDCETSQRAAQFPDWNEIAVQFCVSLPLELGDFLNHS
jgi:hypothetical protein